jgi:hypothetical protein
VTGRLNQHPAALRTLDHHLDRPAIGHFLHLQRLEEVTADRAVGAEIGDLDAVAHPQQRRHQLVAPKLMRRHGACGVNPPCIRVPSTRSAAPAAIERRDQRHTLHRCEAAVAVHEDQDVAGRLLLHTGAAGRAVATLWLHH